MGWGCIYSWTQGLLLLSCSREVGLPQGHFLLDPVGLLLLPCSLEVGKTQLLMQPKLLSSFSGSGGVPRNLPPSTWGRAKLHLGQLLQLLASVRRDDLGKPPNRWKSETSLRRKKWGVAVCPYEGDEFFLFVRPHPAIRIYFS
jgi:hypothetical protein